MGQKSIEVQELKEQLGWHLREIQDGVAVVITDQGKPVARLLPVADQEKRKADLPVLPSELSIDEKIQRLVDAGVVSWSGQRLPPEVPRVPLRGTKTVSEILLEDRD